MELFTGSTQEFAITNSSDYPMGTAEWQLTLANGVTQAVALNFNACDDETQYNCDNGKCISMVVRLVIILNRMKQEPIKND